MTRKPEKTKVLGLLWLRKTIDMDIDLHFMNFYFIRVPPYGSLEHRVEILAPLRVTRL